MEKNDLLFLQFLSENINQSVHLQNQWNWKSSIFLPIKMKSDINDKISITSHLHYTMLIGWMLQWYIVI